jgi:hypothetical protein
VSRRVRMPGAEELFRNTSRLRAVPSGAAAAAPAELTPATPSRRTSGRERHDEKITVYVSEQELLDLEHARLTLRADHALAVDRGRLVREAIAVLLEDFEVRDAQSTLVRRLREG